MVGANLIGSQIRKFLMPRCPTRRTYGRKAKRQLLLPLMMGYADLSGVRELLQFEVRNVGPVDATKPGALTTPAAQPCPLRRARARTRTCQPARVIRPSESAILRAGQQTPRPACACGAQQLRKASLPAALSAKAAGWVRAPSIIPRKHPSDSSTCSTHAP